MTTPVFPIQPVAEDGTGVLRFVKNELVSALLDHGQATGFGLNDLAKKFNKPEHAPHWQQLAQLIGYSMNGYGELDAHNMRALRRAVRRLVQAEVANTWKGGGDPADIPLVERELKAARKHYETVLKRIETGEIWWERKKGT